ncbi:LPXTG cell wall anchor domain-containing protein [Bacillus cereus]|uniref:LPXTG cell wall anchor domain-containing protein n=1 Tax=Bacillus cereus TaxID=1396 RepID=UPI0009445EDD|nr:LPXTG cell wall anchor domain-containing protein [Bacillus cereus]
MTKIFILASTLSLSFFSGLNIGNAATENFQPLTNAIVQNSDHFAEGNSKDNNKPPGNNGSQDDSGSGGNGSGGSGSGGNGSGGNGSGSNGSGGSGSHGGNGSQGGNRVKGDSSSQGGNGSQGGNRVKGDSNSEEGNGSQGDNVKDNTKKQGDKLPNTATHYPISILMGLSTFLIGMLLFIRRKNVK